MESSATRPKTSEVSPYLTIVVSGCNDASRDDLNEGFFQALRFNHDRLTDARVSHEFLFVEWRPLAGRPLLASLLSARFPDRSPEQLRSVVTDAAYHEALSLDPRLKRQEFLAKNVGIRRARGEFILTTNPDICLGPGVVDALASRSLERGVLYRAARHDLGCRSDVAIDWSVLEDERNRELVHEIRPPLFTNAASDFILLDSGTLRRLRGFNEICRSAKFQIDHNFCFMANACGVRLEDLGSPVFRLGRGPRHALGSYWNRPFEAASSDDSRTGNVMYINEAGWGLGAAPQRALDERTIYLDFDWRAIGPMVELNRLKEPTSRLSFADLPGVTDCSMAVREPRRCLI